MKAKEWYNKLCQTSTEEEFEYMVENCLKSLINDADHLIKIRRATSDRAISACLDEVNNKWIAICNLHEADDSHPQLKEYKLLRDGFKAAYVHVHKDRGWYFDIGKHKDYINIEIRKMNEKLIMQPTIKLFGLTPYEEITSENIHKEVLHTLYVMGSYSRKPNSSFDILMVLCHRVRLLRYWMSNGINIDDYKEMEKDPYKFFESRNIPI